MKKFLYLGPQTAIALPPKEEGAEPESISLSPNTEVELPEEMDWVKRAIFNGWLVEPEEPPQPASKRNRQASQEES